MTEVPPRSAETIAVDATTVLPWEEARTRLADARTYWMTTMRPDGAPHVRPVLAVWTDGALHSTSSPVARKGRNLARDARCAVAIGTDVLDLVVEGRMTKITDALQLQRVADAYASKYGWPVKVRDGAFFAEYGAPTAGPPPYEVYVIVPDVVFGFGPTRRSRRVQRAGDSDRTPTSTITARRVWFAAAGRGK